jgi:hypothetical protein
MRREIQTVGAAKARRAACVILCFVMAQGFALASDLSQPASPTSAPLNPDDGHVLVSTDKLRYVLGETIVVRVSNPLDTAVTTWDQRFQCTIIVLERGLESGGAWSEVRNCFSGAPVSPVTLEPGSSTSIRLETNGSPLGRLEPGLYRVSLGYSHGDRLSSATGNRLVARSGQFHVEQQGR